VVSKSDVLANEFDTDYESAVAFGKASVITDDSEKKDILLSVLNKYSAEFLEAGNNYIKKYWDETKVVKIKIEHLSGKAHE
jgi:nitroimidazol reductase NimA-like FMN-containing flavoprotein (pyridoxamine 5'-phosphate oxidase superfamily)